MNIPKATDRTQNIVYDVIYHQVNEAIIGMEHFARSLMPIINPNDSANTDSRMLNLYINSFKKLRDSFLGNIPRQIGGSYLREQFAQISLLVSMGGVRFNTQSECPEIEYIGLGEYQNPAVVEAVQGLNEAVQRLYQKAKLYDPQQVDDLRQQLKTANDGLAKATAHYEDSLNTIQGLEERLGGYQDQDRVVERLTKENLALEEELAGIQYKPDPNDNRVVIGPKGERYILEGSEEDKISIARLVNRVLTVSDQDHTKTELRRAQNELSAAHVLNEDLQLSLLQARDTISEQSGYISRLETTLSRYMIQLEEQKNTITEYIMRLPELIERIGLRDDELSEAYSEIGGLKSKLRIQEVRIEKEIKKYEALWDEHQEIKMQFSEALKREDEALRYREGLSREYQSLRVVLESLNKELDQKKIQLKTKRNLEEKVEELKAKLGKAENVIKDAQEEAARYRRQYEDTVPLMEQAGQLLSENESVMEKADRLLKEHNISL